MTGSTWPTVTAVGADLPKIKIMKDTPPYIIVLLVILTLGLALFFLTRKRSYIVEKKK
jgi:hypothetical protein